LSAPTLSVVAQPTQGSGSKPKGATDAAVRLARARNAVEKLEGQNDKAASILQSLSALWLSADAKRRRGEAEIALNHFNDALAVLRKALSAT